MDYRKAKVNFVLNANKYDEFISFSPWKDSTHSEYLACFLNDTRSGRGISGDEGVYDLYHHQSAAPCHRIMNTTNRKIPTHVRKSKKSRSVFIIIFKVKYTN